MTSGKVLSPSSRAVRRFNFLTKRGAHPARVPRGHRPLARERDADGGQVQAAVSVPGGDVLGGWGRRCSQGSRPRSGCVWGLPPPLRNLALHGWRAVKRCTDGACSAPQAPLSWARGEANGDRRELVRSERCVILRHEGGTGRCDIAAWVAHALQRYPGRACMALLLRPQEIR